MPSCRWARVISTNVRYFWKGYVIRRGTWRGLCGLGILSCFLVYWLKYERHFLSLETPTSFVRSLRHGNHSFSPFLDRPPRVSDSLRHPPSDGQPLPHSSLLDGNVLNFENDRQQIESEGKRSESRTPDNTPAVAEGPLVLRDGRYNWLAAESEIVRGWEGDWDLDKEELYELEWSYNMKEARIPFVAHHEYASRYRSKRSTHGRLYLNSLAVAPGYDKNHLHGKLPYTAKGSNLWIAPEMPPPVRAEKDGEELQDQGFYVALSDALPLSKDTPIDLREKVCKNAHYDVDTLTDVTILITFFNEPLSTLLRTIISVLNTVPPPLLREIIIVDDHSDKAEDAVTGPLYDIVGFLPKVKLMRLHERQGIVHARLTGSRMAKGDVLVFLDSHVELNAGWLEPQLDRIRESPHSIVFPQIGSIDAETFEVTDTHGIGCYLTFRWTMVEAANSTMVVKSIDPIESPSMAGGLFAVKKDLFWHLGGYDEGFIAWGAENVELGFRAWMCGARIECIPCSKTYHIFRKGGKAYDNPVGALWRNKQRTAKVWLDDYYELASPMIDLSANKPHDHSFGNIDNMLDLKRRLGCKPFKWYLENVAPDHDAQEMSEVMILGQLGQNDFCLDTIKGRGLGSPVKPFRCHPSNKVHGTQGIYVVRDEGRIRLMANDKRCLEVKPNKSIVLSSCNVRESAWFDVEEHGMTDGGLLQVSIKMQGGKFSGQCLTITQNGRGFDMVECDQADFWLGQPFQRTPS